MFGKKLRKALGRAVGLGASTAAPVAVAAGLGGNRLKKMLGRKRQAAPAAPAPEPQEMAMPAVRPAVMPQQPPQPMPAGPQQPAMRKGGKVRAKRYEDGGDVDEDEGYSKGGRVRGGGCEQRGKTKGRFV